MNRIAFAVLALATLAALHIRYVGLFLPSDVIRRPTTLENCDYPIRVNTVVEARGFLGRGSLWGYDPRFLAGFVAGRTNTDLLPSIAAWLLPGVDAMTLYKRFVWISFVVAPLLVAAAAWTAGGGATGAVVAMAMAAAFWHGDALSLHYRVFGGPAYLLSAFLAPWALVATLDLVRELAAPTGAIGRRITAASSVMVLTLYAHPLAGAALAAPILVVAVWSVRMLPGRGQLRLLSTGLFVVLLCTPWLVPAAFEAASDNWPIPFPPPADAIANLVHCHGMAVVVLGIAGIGLQLLWCRGLRLQSVCFGVAIITNLGLHLFGDTLGLVGLQGYRNLLPAIAFAILPAANVVVGSRWHRLLALAWLGGVPLGYGSTPRADFAREWRLVYLTDHTPELDELAAWARATPESSRLLIEDPYWPAWSPWQQHGLAILPLLADRELLSPPFGYLQVPENDVRFWSGELRGRDLCAWTADDLRSYLDLYAVTHVAVWSERARHCLQQQPALWAESTPVGLYAALRVRSPTDRWLVGTGSVRASLDTLSVRGATSGSVVLRYHYAPGFRTVPALPVTRHEVAGDAIGFIEVTNGEIRDFDLVFAR